MNRQAQPQACAACRHQRIKCKPDCVLAPYFPANRHKDFAKVHKLFPVKKLIDLFERVQDPIQRHVVTDCLIAEANFRAQYPINGSIAATIHALDKIIQYQDQLEQVQEALAAINAFNAQAQAHRYEPVVQDWVHIAQHYVPQALLQEPGHINIAQAYNGSRPPCQVPGNIYQQYVPRPHDLILAQDHFLPPQYLNLVQGFYRAPQPPHHNIVNNFYHAPQPPHHNIVNDFHAQQPLHLNIGQGFYAPQPPHQLNIGQGLNAPQPLQLNLGQEFVVPQLQHQERGNFDQEQSNTDKRYLPSSSGTQ